MEFIYVIALYYDNKLVMSQTTQRVVIMIEMSIKKTDIGSSREE